MNSMRRREDAVYTLYVLWIRELSAQNQLKMWTCGNKDVKPAVKQNEDLNSGRLSSGDGSASGGSGWCFVAADRKWITDIRAKISSAARVTADLCKNTPDARVPMFLRSVMDRLTRVPWHFNYYYYQTAVCLFCICFNLPVLSLCQDSNDNGINR